MLRTRFSQGVWVFPSRYPDRKSRLGDAMIQPDSSIVIRTGRCHWTVSSCRSKPSTLYHEEGHQWSPCQGLWRTSKGESKERYKQKRGPNLEAKIMSTTVRRTLGRCCSERTTSDNRSDEKNKSISIYLHKKKYYFLEETIFLVGDGIGCQAPVQLDRVINTEVLNTAEGGLTWTQPIYQKEGMTALEA